MRGYRKEYICFFPALTCPRGHALEFIHIHILRRIAMSHINTRYTSEILAELDAHEAAGHAWCAEARDAFEARKQELLDELTVACEEGRDDTN